MRLLLKLMIIATATGTAAIAAAPHTGKPPGSWHLRNQSHALLMLRGMKGPGIVTHALHKASAQMEWVETSSSNFLYSPSTQSWSLYFRDTSIYNSQGRLALVKTSLAQTGWSIDSIYEIDSTIWRGSQPLEYDTLYFYNGELDSASCVRWTLSYSADRTTFAKTEYIYGSDSWIIAGVDFLVCASPIVDPYFYFYNDSSSFISLRSYAKNDLSGTLELVSSKTKIEAESNSALLTLLSLIANAGGAMDSSKIYETISSDSKTISADSVIVKSASGAWIPYSRASNSFNAAGDWFYRGQMFLQGAWTTSDSLLWFADGSGFEIYHPTPDSLEAYFWDAYGNDTLEVTANKTDTTFQHWMNTYDDNDNLIIEVGYTSDRSGSNKIKTDSSAFTYAQIKVSPVRFKRISPAAAAVSFEQTPSQLRITAADITGLRLYDIAGRMIASMNQPPAPMLSIAWRSLRKQPARQIYMAQVITGRGILTHRICCEH